MNLRKYLLIWVGIERIRIFFETTSVHPGFAADICISALTLSRPLGFTFLFSKKWFALPQLKERNGLIRLSGTGSVPWEADSASSLSLTGWPIRKRYCLQKIDEHKMLCMIPVWIYFSLFLLLQRLLAHKICTANICRKALSASETEELNYSFHTETPSIGSFATST